MNIVFRDGDISDVDDAVRGGRRQDLHNANSTGGAHQVLPEGRLLVSLGYQKKPVETVLARIFFKSVARSALTCATVFLLCMFGRSLSLFAYLL